MRDGNNRSLSYYFLFLTEEGIFDDSRQFDEQYVEAKDYFQMSSSSQCAGHRIFVVVERPREESVEERGGEQHESDDGHDARRCTAGIERACDILKDGVAREDEDGHDDELKGNDFYG